MSVSRSKDHLMVVSSSKPRANEVINKIRASGIEGKSFVPGEGGFTNVIVSRQTAKFLKS